MKNLFKFNSNFWFRILCFIVVYVSFVFVSLNRDSKARKFTYQSEIWSDKAGYHIYLPFFCTYDGDIESLPDSLEAKLGNGFKIEEPKGKLLTKYTYGVALMQSPFYYIGSFFRNHENGNDAVFEMKFQSIINFAACFYLLLGLIFLRKFLEWKGISTLNSYISIVGLLLSTNLIYFGLFETGMSHVYSFFAFSLYLFTATIKSKSLYRIMIGVSIGLIVIVRPLNALFIPFLLFLKGDESQNYIENLRREINLVSIVTGLILITPQLLYWKYATGHFLFYSYQGEGFTNIFNPPIAKFLFSPNNGLLLYAPILLLVLFGLYKLKFRNFKAAIVLTSCFAFFIWISAGWWNWHYGCSYGCRPFVEMMAIFSYPLAYFLQSIQSKKGLILITTVIAVFTLINLKFIYSSDNCWYYGDWNFEVYLSTLLGPTH